MSRATVGSRARRELGVAAAIFTPLTAAAQAPASDAPPPPSPAASAVPQLAVPTTEEALLSRIEELLPVLEEARSAAEAAERRRALELEARSRRPTEVFHVGPLQIVAPPEQAALAAALFQEVWSASFEGVTGSPALARHVFVFQWAWRTPGPLRVDPAESGRSAVERVELTRAWSRTRSAARSRIRDAIWTTLRGDLADDSPVGRWIGSAGYPLGQQVARSVTGTSAAGGACLTGDAEACRRGLGLTPEEGSAPLEARAMLLLEAVRMGGEDAWPRLLERSGADPLPALSYAAGTDGEAVLAAWRERVVAERPDIHTSLAGQAARALLWVIALGALAMKSTRWRLT